MSLKITYRFASELWKYEGKGAWYFVSLPIHISKEIREHLKNHEEGWGRMKTKAQIGASIWDTSIWYDTKKGTYILPIKAEIRKEFKLETGKNVDLIIYL